jgi:hypothetical protein
VDLAGDGATPAGRGLAAPWGKGLGQGLVAEDRAGVFLTEGTCRDDPLLLLAEEGSGEGGGRSEDDPPAWSEVGIVFP